MLLLLLLPIWAQAESVVIHGKRGKIERAIVATQPNPHRPHYAQLTLKRGAGEWLFRADNTGSRDRAGSRNRIEMAYFHISHEVGLRTVPFILPAEWSGQFGTHLGTLQRVVPNANRSTGTVDGDLALVEALRVDWDTLHALAIHHHVTSMHDDMPYNILVSRSAASNLVYNAIDGERSLGTSSFGRNFTAMRLIKGKGAPKEMSDALWQRIRSTDFQRLRLRLGTDGIDPHEIDRVVRKVREVQTHGLDPVKHPVDD